MSLGKVWNKIGSRVLVYGGDWESAKSSVRALTYGKMVDLSRDKIHYYMSDLYHDALWLDQELNGPMEFEWIARESGTWIGETAKLVKDDDWTNSTRYRFEIREDDNQKWVLDTYELVVHEGTPIETCEYATTAAGCIYHPASVETRCTGYRLESGLLQHDGDTCPIHEHDTETEFAVPNNVSMDTPVARDDLVDEIMGLLLPNQPTMVPPGHALTPDGGIEEIPTLRNDLTMEPSAPTRKEMKMDDIIRDLRSKYDEADTEKGRLEEYQSEINDALEELETYMSDLDDLISSLDSLPEVSIYVDLDTVSFDS